MGLKMGLFKEIKCVNCNEKTNPLTRKKLTDGLYLCSVCKKKLPYYLRDYDFDLETYKGYVQYIKKQQELCRNIFKETRNYATIHVDTEHALFYLSDKIFGNSIDDNTLFMRLQDIEEFDLIFSPDTYKEGTFGDKLKGNVLMRLKMRMPEFYYEDTVVYGETAKVKKGLLGSKYSYQEPTSLTDFLTFFNLARDAANEVENYVDNELYAANNNFELQQAMALFMIDSLDEITPEKLKSLRNKLIMTFHPDKGDDDKRHLQKINAAYEIIIKELNN